MSARRLFCGLGLLAACQSARLPEPGIATLGALDRDGSSTLTASELGRDADAILRAADQNADGALDADELADHLAQVPHSPLRMKAAQRGKARRNRPRPTHEEAQMQADVPGASDTPSPPPPSHP